MEENKSFLKKVWTSIKDFEKYEEFAADKVHKAVIYLLLLTLIFTFIVSIVYTYKIYTSVQDAVDYIYDDIEDIRYKDRKIRYYI